MRLICFKVLLSVFALTFNGCDAINSYRYKELNEEFDDNCQRIGLILFQLAPIPQNAISDLPPKIRVPVTNSKTLSGLSI